MEGRQQISNRESNVQELREGSWRDHDRMHWAFYPRNLRGNISMRGLRESPPGDVQAVAPINAKAQFSLKCVLSGVAQTMGT